MTESSEALVAVERRADGVAVVRLANPKVNALSSELLRQLRAVADDLTETPPGAVVVTGGDRVFAAGADQLTATDGSLARDLAAWKLRVLDGWAGVAVGEVTASEEPVGLGTTRTVQVTVTLGSLTAADVAVQLVHGTVGQGDELLGPEVTDLEPVEGSGTDGHAVYGGSILCTRPGRYGFTVRVAPTHPAPEITWLT